MTDAAAAGGPGAGRSATGDAVRSAEQALSSAREAVAAVVTVRARAVQEGRRLRERAEVQGLDALAEEAALQERRAAALEARIEQLRDLARRAEVAHEALRADRGDEPAGTPGPADAASGGTSGPADAASGGTPGGPADAPGPGDDDRPATGH